MKGEGSPSERLRSEAGNFGYEIISNDLTFVDRIVGVSPRFAGTISAVIRRVRHHRRSTKGQADRRLLLNPFGNKTNMQLQMALRKAWHLDAQAPVIGLLDTGVNRGHPLLAPVIAPGDWTELEAWLGRPQG